jgi:uncharacterized protein
VGDVMVALVSSASAVLAGQLLVLAKAPRPGRVKTRLCPPFTPVQAAELAAAALADTLAAVAETSVADRVLVMDGDPAAVDVPASYRVIPQRGGGLDERLAAAFDDAECGLPQLLVGMDTPQLTAAMLTDAMQPLLAAEHDAVLGPTADGGYWCVGLRRPDAALLTGVPMSTPWTYAAQRRRLEDHRLRVATVPLLHDVDTAADARLVAGLAPHSRFAAALRAAGVGAGTGAAS